MIKATAIGVASLFSIDNFMLDTCTQITYDIITIDALPIGMIHPLYSADTDFPE